MKELYFFFFLLSIIIINLNSDERTYCNIAELNHGEKVEIVTSDMIAEWYVSPKGNDAFLGTINAPFRTLARAAMVVRPGQIIYLRGGRYDSNFFSSSYMVRIENKSGTKDQPIRLWNYPGETPVFDGHNLSSLNLRCSLYFSNCNNWDIRGIEVTGTPQYNNPDHGSAPCFSWWMNGCSNLRIERCSSHDNQGVGLRIDGDSDSVIIKNCDFFNNLDPYTYNSGNAYPGGDADGLDILVPVLGNYISVEGSRSWNNSDDGFDCYQNNAYVSFKNCWSFFNGRASGDGNAFKLGPHTENITAVPSRLLTNCLAASNKGCGFDYNNGRSAMWLFNNVSYNNGKAGFEFYFGGACIFRNNISFRNTPLHELSSTCVHDHNSWNGGVSVSDADFISLDVSLLSLPRSINGDLPYTEAFRLAEGSDLINSGINVGLPYSGSAPDLGAFENKNNNKKPLLSIGY